MMRNIEIYQALNGEIEFRGDVAHDTIWASLEQIAKLFGRDKSGISRHIKNIFKSGELDKDAVVAIFATTAKDGKTYQVEYYNLDMILSIGYRVDSKEATQFRKWATKVLKEYIYNGYAINSQKITVDRFIHLEDNVNALRQEVQSIKEDKNQIQLTQGVFYNGQIYDAYVLVNDIFKQAQEEVVLIDNYIDDTVLTLFSKYPKLHYTIMTKSISKQLKLDISRYNSQYNNLTIKKSNRYHDRFLILDKTKAYHIGASLKDLGKKVFAFSEILRLDDA